MASRFSFGLLLVLTTVLESSSAQTTAAPGTLGGACSASGSPSCANPDYICHNNTCALKAGAQCADYPDSCVTGSTCNGGTNQCACNDNLIQLGSGSCVPFVGLGGTCSRFDTCHGKAALACVDSKCLIQVGQTCADTRECVTGAQCNSSSQCQCSQGYFDYDKNQEQKCRRQAAIGADCSDGADCVSDDSNVDLKCDFYKFTCVIKSGDRCDANTEMFCPSGAECQDNTCTCITPYESDKGACSKVISTLGGMCGSGDNCKNDALGLDMDCDRFSGRCLLEVGQPCQGYPDMCSTGAVCSNTSRTCVCSGLYTLSDSARSCQGRQGTIGGKCNSGNMCSDTASAKCDDGYCLCKTGYFIATSSSCFAGTAPKLNEPCQGHLTCFDANGPPLVCDGYRSICVIQESENCTHLETSCPTGATCTNGVCTCLPGYDDKSHSCKKIVTTLGEVCQPFDYCRSNNSALRITCDALSSTCLIGAHRSCENHTDGCTTGAKCDNITKTCVCAGLYTQSPDAGFCQAPVGKAGGHCSTGNACSDANAECKDDLCLCKTGFTIEPSDASCQKVTNLGSACNPTDTCSNDVIPAPSMTCDPLSGRCLIKAHQKCQSHTDQCTTGAKCDVTTKTCLCDGVYTESSDGSYCQAAQGKAGGECNTGSSCSDSNAECKDGLCLCKTGYKVKASDASCEKSDEDSGIGRAAGSVLCLVVAYVLGRLV